MKIEKAIEIVRNIRPQHERKRAREQRSLAEYHPPKLRLSTAADKVVEREVDDPAIYWENLNFIFEDDAVVGHYSVEGEEGHFIIYERTKVEFACCEMCGRVATDRLVHTRESMGRLNRCGAPRRWKWKFWEYYRWKWQEECLCPKCFWQMARSMLPPPRQSREFYQLFDALEAFTDLMRTRVSKRPSVAAELISRRP